LDKVNKAYDINHKTGDPHYEKFEYVKAIFTDLNSQVKRSNNPNVKIMACIGGWNVANNTGAGTKEYGDNLNNTAKGFLTDGMPSSPMAKAFITNIKGLLQPGYIQGIDIDWEYPGRLPIESMCKDKSGVSKACKVNEPTQIGPCDASSNKGCSAFAYEKSMLCPGGIDSKTKACRFYCNNKATYRKPISNGGLDSDYNIDLLPPYLNFMKGIKKETFKMKSELSIAMAGAPNGLSWYINTLYQLLVQYEIIDFASIMAYDYNGFWGGGQTSGFLANFTNMTTHKKCQMPPPPANTCQSEKCVEAYKAGGGCYTNCQSGQEVCGSYDGTKYQCIWPSDSNPGCKPRETKACRPSAISWDGCPDDVNFKFTKASDNNYYTPSKAKSCPFILYNLLGVDNRNQNLVESRSKFFNTIYDTTTYHNWFDDNTQNISDSYTDSKNPLITLSIKTMLRVLTDVYAINPKKLVIGLPYYGRSFQTGDDPDNLVTPPTKSFSKGSLGLYQPYQYGTTYSYSDIYQTYYKAGNKKDVYTIMLDKGDGSNPEYTEDIVYAKGGAMLSHVTSKMTEEMISYNSEESIKTKVKYAADKGYGGYMCWHMLSDYYPV
jgi:GH18 family chitinase